MAGVVVRVLALAILVALAGCSDGEPDATRVSTTTTPLRNTAPSETDGTDWTYLTMAGEALTVVNEPGGPVRFAGGRPSTIDAIDGYATRNDCRALEREAEFWRLTSYSPAITPEESARSSAYERYTLDKLIEVGCRGCTELLDEIDFYQRSEGLDPRELERAAAFERYARHKITEIVC